MEVVSADPRLLAGMCAVVIAMPHLARADVDVRGEHLEARWSNAVDEARRALARRDDVDTFVEVIVSPASGGVRVVARRPSGERAERHVDDVDDLGPTIFALVVVPRTARLEPVHDAELPADLIVRVIAPRSGSRRDGFELGAALGARWQGSIAVGGHVFADLAAGPWLVGANLGWTTGGGDQRVVDPASAETTTEHYALRTFEIGIELGRRVELGPVEVTALVGPRLAMSTRSFQDVPAPTMSLMRTGPMVSSAFDVPDVREARLAGGLRAWWTSSAHLQLLLGVDATLDVARWLGPSHPTDAAEVTVVEAPARPAWGIAVTLGGMFEVGR